MPNKWVPAVATAAFCVVVGLAVMGFTWMMHSKRAWGYFGADTWSVIEQADEVQVHRLAPSAGTVQWGKQPAAIENHLAGKPVEPPRQWVKQLRETLRNPDSYRWNTARRCLPAPGVAVRFKQDARKVDVIFCFECDMLSIGPAGVTRWEALDPARYKYVQLMKQIFPKDPAIRALKEVTR
jgi:hypothetical protein